MARPHPHPLALFSLKPLNPRAENIVAHPCNDCLVSTLKDGTLALDIGHIRSRSGNATLATLGRGDADIFIGGSSIAKVQCSFEIDLNTSVVMLYDRSHSQTTQVFGQNATPFEYGRPRKGVVQEGLNTIIGMGGEGRNLVQFQLIWRQSPAETMERVRNRESVPLEENPRLARTVDEADTVLPSRRETRLHTPGPKQPKLRYAKIIELGSGQFGDVYKAVDADSGKLMAVKILKRPARVSLQEWRISLYHTLKREVEILSEISHPHIVDYIASQGWDGPEVEIFMGLKEGTLESLINNKSSSPIVDLADAVFHQMLQALDCLATKGIIHRDVKPENILYVSRLEGQYQFQLGDFGLCNRALSAATFVGSPLYMAPEMFQKGDQTHKVDIWSLFVTVLWTLDVRGFRRKSKQFKSIDDAQKMVLFAAENVDTVSRIREMASVDPDERSSAAQMLVKCYNGEGLSTPRNHVSALVGRPAKAPVAASPTSTTAQQTRKDPPKHVAITGQFRVRKCRSHLHTQLPKQPINLAAEKRLGQPSNLMAVEKPDIPGTFPEDSNSSAEPRNRPPERVYFT